MMCRELGVTSSGYYGYIRRHRDRPDDAYHQELLEAVRDIAKASGDSYGSRRMEKALNALSYTVSRNKARKLMQEAGVQVRYRKKYKTTTNSDHKQPVFDNVLDRQFNVAKPDQVYVGDKPICGRRKAGCTLLFLSTYIPERWSAGASAHA
jgi:putative transposase